LLGKLTDLNIPLPPEENIRVFYARDFRGKSKLSGKVIYVGLSGPGGAVDCYSFQSSDGAFRCFDPKGGGVPTPPINSGAPTPPVNSGGAPVNGGRIFAPIRGAPVTSLFGMRFHPILHILRLHAGIDFGAPVGSQVRAVADGKVEIAGPVSGFGNHVRVQHRGFETSYSHLSEISVAVGANVTQGQIIALSGNTGLSTGPHLHFEYYLDRVAVDPMPHMGTEVAGAGGAVAAVAIGAAPPSEQEIAAFAASKTMVDAALQAASE
jgi:murein DD-endopeptidase MepM/ murein hydrolase activator NlpD